MYDEILEPDILRQRNENHELETGTWREKSVTYWELLKDLVKIVPTTTIDRLLR